MGSIGGLLGVSGGAGGTGFAGPASAPITNPVMPGQTDTAYQQNQAALQQQQQLLQALQAQNGIGNQSQVYNQLQQVAAGQGPNPAQAMLNQATGANVANQAALMAGQRGASANPGLIARQAAQQGANLQQQAVDQGATMQANQALNAMNAAGNLANQQAGQQIGATTANTQAQQGEQGQLLNAVQGVNNANVGAQNSVNAANAGMASTRLQGQQGLIGGVLGGAGAALGLAQGGVIPKLADGGDIGQSMSQQLNQPLKSGPQSSFGKFLQGANNAMAPDTNNYGNAGANQLQQGTSDFVEGIGNAFRAKDPAPIAIAGGQGEGMGSMPTMVAAEGGKVPALVSPGERYLPPEEVAKVKKGEKSPMEAGEKIPGKPKYPGNDYRNDTEKKTLKSGGVVLPNSVTQSKHPHWAAHKFMLELAKKR